LLLLLQLDVVVLMTALKISIYFDVVELELMVETSREPDRS